MRQGVILINLGTPENFDKRSVRRFLKEFLSDPRVVDIPWIFKNLLLYLFILPFRPKQSAKAYAAIWDAQKGSPLLYHTQQLVTQLQAYMGEAYLVEVGMRYGQPSIAQAVEKLLKKGCDKLLAIPLFPQYSGAASGSSIEKLLDNLKGLGNIPHLQVIADFYDAPAFIAAQALLIKPFLKVQKVLFSYHSLPQRQIIKNTVGCRDCLKGACPSITASNRFCYRAQCFATSRLLAQQLGLALDQYEVVFQSRLGRAQWIEPEIQHRMRILAQEGVKDLLVACPSFVVDCLETLEEIGIQAQALWQRLGGETFTLVPCLNAHPAWVEVLGGWIKANGS